MANGTDWGSRGPQYPANAASTLGEHSFLALGRIHIGTGGLPVPTRSTSGTGIPTGLRTVYGYEGITATLVGTGLYEVGHPPATVAAVFPQYVGPSGQAGQLTPQWSPGNSASGLVRIQATTFNTPTGATPPSGAARIPFNPPSGTRLDLLFYVNPRNDQGITQY